MIHFSDQYDPPCYRIACNRKWMEPDWDLDVAPYDEIYIGKDKTKYSPEEAYVTCPQCLKLLREDDTGEEGVWLDMAKETT